MDPETAAESPDPRDAEFDRFAREASASLRRPAPSTGADAIARAADRRRAKQKLLGAVGAAVVVIAGLAVASARNRDRSGTVPPPTSSPTTATSSVASTSTATTVVATTTVAARPRVPRSSLADVPTVQSAAAAGMAEFDIPANPKQLATDGTTLWILHGSGLISRRDARTGADLGAITEVPIGFAVERPEVAFGALWVTTASDDTLRRIDATTGSVVASIKIPGDISVRINDLFDHPESANVTASETAVWVLVRGDAPAFVEIDPATNTVVRQVPAPEHAWNVRYGFGSLWTVDMVAVGSSEPLVRVDPADGRQIGSIPGVGSTDIAFGFGSIWSAELVDGQESWTRFDPDTNQPVAEIIYPAGGVLQTDFAIAGGHVWANEGAVGLAKIDPVTNRIVARYVEATGGGGTAATDTAVWFANGSTSKLYRLPLA